MVKQVSAASAGIAGLLPGFTLPQGAAIAAMPQATDGEQNTDTHNLGDSAPAPAAGDRALANQCSKASAGGPEAYKILTRLSADKVDLAT